MPRSIRDRYRFCMEVEGFVPSAILSFLAFSASIYITYMANAYATARASNPVTDLILSNTPVFEVDDYFVYGAALLALFVILLLFLQPKRFPFTLYALALFYTIRAGFITLTHLAPFPQQSPIDITTNFGIFISKFFVTSGDDLFFSAHTGAPFLLALIFWEQKFLRYIFLACSIFFAGVVLLGHLHYSIDVASAYFITYTIFIIATRFFKKSLARFKAAS